MLRHCDLFAGIGGFTLAAEQVGGITTTQFVEINPDGQRILQSHWPTIPIHDDIRTYHPGPGEFDLITCGFPCTGTSNAGKREGLKHPESALWREGMRVCIECRPQFLVIEQPEGVARRGLRTILATLYMAGYTSEVEIVSAKELGAGHRRPRLFIISYPDELRLKERATCWEDQIRELVEGSRLNNEWLAVRNFSNRLYHGLSVRLVRGLNEVELQMSHYTEPTNTAGRIRSRYLAGEQLPQDKQRSPLSASSTSIPSSSECPYCQQSLLKLSDGCGVCGWLPSQIFLGEKSTVSNPRNSTKELSPGSKISPKKNPKGISFGKTLQQLFNGKCCTRRVWSDRHAQTFIKYFEQQIKVPALDKDLRANGQIVGWLTLTQKPYQDKLSNMTQSDLIAESFPDYSVQQFIDEFFDGNANQLVWVIWFNFEPLNNNQEETTERSLSNPISPKKNPSGSLYQFIQNKRNKDGLIKTYPKIIEESRDPNNPDHWLWAYCYEEKDDKGKWRTRKRSVSRERIEDVKRAIKSGKSVREILKIIN